MPLEWFKLVCCLGQFVLTQCINEFRGKEFRFTINI